MAPGNRVLVGMDEAGYGPNLGPLVVVATMLEASADVPSSGLWDRLRGTASRWPVADPHVLVVDDSKKVYKPDRGLGALERTVLAWLGLCGSSPRSLRELWQRYCLTPREDLEEGPWLADQVLELPRETNLGILEADRQRLAAALDQAGLRNPSMVCQIIMPRRFNEMVARADSKGVTLFQIAAEILRHVWDTTRLPRIEAVLDKHGGRNFYRPLLQQQFHESLVLCGREGALLSQYQVSAGGRSFEFSFLPKADSDHFLVALASMVAKYLRELCMILINAYWTRRVPGLRPTAGYPVDAQRFWGAIAETACRDGIDPELVWRQK